MEQREYRQLKGTEYLDEKWGPQTVFLTNRSGSGSRRPKNIRIRIRNTVVYNDKIITKVRRYLQNFKTGEIPDTLVNLSVSYHFFKKRKQVLLFSSRWPLLLKNFQYTYRYGTLGWRMRHKEHCLGPQFNPHSLVI